MITSPHRKAYEVNFARKKVKHRRGSRHRPAWEAQKKLQNGLCFDCNKTRKLTRGHLFPLCKGGRNTVLNIIGQCKKCNSKQGGDIHLVVYLFAIWMQINWFNKSSGDSAIFFNQLFR